MLALFDTGTGMSCMSYECSNSLPRKSYLNKTHMLSVHSARDHDLYPMNIVNCKVALGNTLMIHSFIVCKHLTKDLVIGLDMQQILHWL